jgi:hypothetical protein
MVFCHEGLAIGADPDADRGAWQAGPDQLEAGQHLEGLVDDLDLADRGEGNSDIAMSALKLLQPAEDQ